MAVELAGAFLAEALHGAEHIESYLRDRPVPGVRTRTIFNPFFQTSDSLMTCWLARDEMRGDFLLVDGDTVFEHGVLDAVLDSKPSPITLAIGEKLEYDADDMKVELGSGLRLARIGKDLQEDVHGEATGLIAFRGEGSAIFRAALECAVREPGALTANYLSVIDRLTAPVFVDTVAITGLWWGAVDTPEDLVAVREALNPDEDYEDIAPPHGESRPILELVR